MLPHRNCPRMDVVAVGVGGAGGRIVDELHRDDAGRSVSYLAASRVFDTDTSSLGALDRVPSDARHPFGTLEFDGSGADSDADAARDAAADQATELRRELDEVITTSVTGILLVAGLGGGTGPGATPVLAEELTRVYDRPVYCVSVLPTGDDETACENAARGVEALDSVVDCQIAFDNDAWTGEDDSLEDRLPALNRELADRLEVPRRRGIAGRPSQGETARRGDRRRAARGGDQHAPLGGQGAAHDGLRPGRQRDRARAVLRAGGLAPSRRGGGRPGLGRQPV
ncbi:hypothetical protein BRC69_03985 [Halobacteriales archaeon QH_6_66_25]|nr:MAG: hypothetical protein BRC69_03985 [Halobacteriales archaeon QH_6_66_25]